MLVTKLRLIGIGSLVVPTLLGAASIAVADEVTVKLVVADRTTNNNIDAAIYSFQTCATYTDSCIAIDMFSAKNPPLVMKCLKGVKLFGRVSVSGYYAQSTSEICSSNADPILLLATRQRDPAWLLATGRELLASGRAAEAVVFLAESNAQKPSPETSEQTLLAAAKALGVKSDDALVFDPQQNRKVASPKLYQVIKEFQRQNNILTDGVLGPDTMKVLAKASSPNVIQGYVLRASTVVGCDQEKNLRSLALNQPTTVTFTNHTEGVRRLYWLNHNGERVLYATLQPGMVFQAQTYITHSWVVADASDKCQAIYMPTSDASDIALNR